MADSTGSKGKANAAGVVVVVVVSTFMPATSDCGRRCTLLEELSVVALDEGCCAISIANRVGLIASEDCDCSTAMSASACCRRLVPAAVAAPSVVVVLAREPPSTVPDSMGSSEPVE